MADPGWATGAESWGPCTAAPLKSCLPVDLGGCGHLWNGMTEPAIEEGCARRWRAG